MTQTSRTLRPLSFSDLFDEVFSLYRENFVLMVGVAGLVYVPYNILLKLLQSSMYTSQTNEQILAAAGTLLWSTLLFFIASLLSEAALTKAIAERYLGHPSGIASAYGFALQRFFPFLGTILLVVLAYFVGFLALFIGALFVFFMLAFVVPVFVVEDRSFTDAMGRSRELAKENWGRIFLVGLVTWLLSFVVQLGIGAFSSLFGTTGIQAVFAGAIEGVAEAVALPIGLIAFVLLYFDIRVRKEGYDLTILAQEMSARAGGIPGATGTPPAPPTRGP